MPHNLLLGRLLPADWVLQGGGNAEARLVRLPLRPPDLPPGRARTERRPDGEQREARRDFILQKRR